MRSHNRIQAPLATLIVGALSVSAPLAIAADDATSGKLSYRSGSGTSFSFGDDFNLRMFLESRTRYQFTDNDGSEDTSSFEVRQARLNFAGDLLGKQFSFRIGEEFTGANGSSLRDAFIQWNADETQNVRMGQYKQPFSRQELVSDVKQEFIDRSQASDFFAPKRQQGAMYSGSLEEFNYAFSLYNRESETEAASEGQNRSGIDTKMFGVAQAYVNFGEYGKRDEEGDYAMTSEPAATAGLAGIYGQATEELGDVDVARANVDLGFRYEGFALQTEGYYQTVEPDGNSDGLDDYGFYAQLGYFFVPKQWQVAARFGLIDTETQSFEKSYEYSGVINYYINGHALKLQTGVTAIDREFDEGDDTTDIRYQFQVVALL